MDSVHDALTGVTWSFQTSVRTLRFLVERGAGDAAVFVCTALNAKVLKPALLFAGELGVRRVLLARFNVGGRGIGNCRDLLPSREELAEAFGRP